jgi:hypothetical protein
VDLLWRIFLQCTSEDVGATLRSHLLALYHVSMYTASSPRMRQSLIR